MMKLSILLITVVMAFSAQGQSRLPDPTKPLIATQTAKAAEKPEAQALRLEALMRKGKTWLAIINGTMLQQGQQIEGYTVARIDASSVELVNRQETKRLALFDNQITIKKEASNEF